MKCRPKTVNTKTKKEKAVERTVEGTVNAPAPFYPTHLDRFIAEGERRISIYVWDKLQRAPAGLYVKAVLARHPDKWVDVQIFVSRKPVRTGDKSRSGRVVIRYHFA